MPTAISLQPFLTFMGRALIIWEFNALKDGLILCKALHISPVYLIVIRRLWLMRLISSAYGDNRRFSYVLRDCLALFTSNFTISYGFWLKNVVADRLADFAYTHRGRQEFYRAQDLRRTVRPSYLADKMELWNFRHSIIVSFLISSCHCKSYEALFFLC